jgi:hypothetical protein
MVSGGVKNGEAKGLFCFVAVSDFGPIISAQKYAFVALQLYFSEPGFPTHSTMWSA